MPPRASPPTLPLTPSRVCRGGPHGNQRLCQEVRRQASCFLTQKGWGAWNTSGSWELRLAPTSRPGPPAGRRGHPCRARRRHRDTSRRQLACPHAAHHGRRHPPRERRRATRRRQLWCSTGGRSPGRRSTSGRGGSPRRSARPVSARRTASRSSTRTASSTSRCSSAPPCSTPCASTSTGGSPPPEVEYIVNDAGAKVFVVGARLRAGPRRHRRRPRRRSARSS